MRSVKDMGVEQGDSFVEIYESVQRCLRAFCKGVRRGRTPCWRN